MSSLPSQLALTSIADGSNIVAADHRTNYLATQTAVNALISALAAGSVGDVLTSGGATAVSWSSSATGTTYRKTTSKAVANSIAETDLLNGEITVAAGAMGANGFVRMRLWGDSLNNTGAQQFSERFKVKLGASATVVIDTGSDVSNSSGVKAWGVTAGATRVSWWMDVVIENRGATNSQMVKFNYHRDGGTGFANLGSSPFVTGSGFSSSCGANGYATFEFGGYNLTAIDTTAAMAVVVSVINPVASASMDTTLLGALVEVL